MIQTLDRTTGTIKFLEFEGQFRKTSQAAMDDPLNELSAFKDEWAALAIGERIQILDEMMEAMVEVSEEWVAVSLEMKNETCGGFGEGEEWTSIWPIFRLLRISPSRTSSRAVGRAFPDSAGLRGGLQAKPRPFEVHDLIVQLLEERLGLCQ